MILAAGNINRIRERGSQEFVKYFRKKYVRKKYVRKKKIIAAYCKKKRRILR